MSKGKKTIPIVVLVFIALFFAFLTNQSVEDYLKTNYQFYANYQGTIHNLIGTYLLPATLWAITTLVLLILWHYILTKMSPRLSPTDVNTFHVLGRLIIVPFCIIAFLNTFNTFQGTLLGVAALFGTAIGFASTNTIGNLLAGLYLMILRPFAIGDYVIFPTIGAEGIIQEISINYTKLAMRTGNSQLITNNQLLTQTVINTRIIRKNITTDNKETKKILYLYPVIWGVNSADPHSIFVKAIQQTTQEFTKFLAEPLNWFVLNRNVWERQYQIDLTLSNAYNVLELSKKFRTLLAENYDKAKTMP